MGDEKILLWIIGGVSGLAISGFWYLLGQFNLLNKEQVLIKIALEKRVTKDWVDNNLTGKVDDIKYKVDRLESHFKSEFGDGVVIGNINKNLDSLKSVITGLNVAVMGSVDRQGILAKVTHLDTVVQDLQEKIER